MKTFTELTQEVIWQNDNVCSENAQLKLKSIFSDFILEISNKMSTNASIELFKISQKIREEMEEKNVEPETAEV